MSSKATIEEKVETQKESLPVNHPQAGYVDPDLSFTDQHERSPDLKKEFEEKVKARAEDVEKIADAEDKVVKAERAAALEATG